MKKGFTLIELLAVIVMLAIIALIAVPIVVNIINNAKKSSEEQSLELYKDAVQKSIAKYQMTHPEFNPNKCDIQKSGDIECNNTNISIDMKGPKPSKGTIIIENNKVSFKNVVLNNKKYYVISELISDSDNNGEISIGDKYAYKVNDRDTFNFYVLNIEEDKVNLIMDRNVCEDGSVAIAGNLCTCAWHEGEINNNYGPDTAMTKLYNATKEWSNVLNMELNYLDENIGWAGSANGYTGFVVNNGIATILGKNGAPNTTIGTKEQPLRARLPKLSEVVSNSDTRLCSHNGPCNQCPNWLVDNLTEVNNFCGDIYTSNQHINGIEGYWLLSSYEGNQGAIYITNSGNDAVWTTEKENIIGIRPVITVPLEYLQ